RIRLDLRESELFDCHLALGKAYGEQRLTKEAVDSFVAALTRTPDRAGKIRVIAAAASVDGLLQKLAEAQVSDGLLQAEVARHFARQGNAPLAAAAYTKARAAFEEKLAKEPEDSLSAAN